jgi:hypothetical protein
LEKSYQKLQPSNVFFVGVNTFDQPDTSRAFAAAHGVTYPSIIDVDSGATRLAFAGKMSPTNTPTTIVLDQRGASRRGSWGSSSRHPFSTSS